MATQKIELGATGEAVRRNIRAHRRGLNCTLDDVSALLTETARPLSKASLSQIETGKRRVDVDDLAAIADVLGVDPADLLVPRNDAESAYIEDQFGWSMGDVTKRLRRIEEIVMKGERNGDD